MKFSINKTLLLLSGYPNKYFFLFFLKRTLLSVPCNIELLLEKIFKVWKCGVRENVFAVILHC